MPGLCLQITILAEQILGWRYETKQFESEWKMYEKNVNCNKGETICN